MGVATRCHLRNQVMRVWLLQSNILVLPLGDITITDNNHTVAANQRLYNLQVHRELAVLLQWAVAVAVAVAVKISLVTISQIRQHSSIRPRALECNLQPISTLAPFDVEQWMPILVFLNLEKFTRIAWVNNETKCGRVKV